MPLPMPGSASGLTPIAPQYAYKSHTGNRIMVQMGKSWVGMMSDLTVSESMGAQTLTQIGDIQVAEIIPTVATYHISSNMVVLKTDTMYSGFNGGQALAPDTAYDALYFIPFNIVVLDTDGGNNPIIARQWNMVYFDSGQISIRANQAVIFNATFLGQSAKGTFKTLAN